MAYIGKAPLNGFHSKQQLTGDGSTVTYTLDFTVADETALIVSVGGVLQEPKTAFDLVQGGTKITFTEAPASTDRVYIQFLGTAIVQKLLDINGGEFILDVDADTSFTADTDDEIDIKVGGTDRSTIKATGFHNVDSVKFVAGTGDDMQMYHDGTNSYLTNSTGALKVATETSGIAITLGHTTSEVTIADNATVTGNLTVTGTLTQTGSQTFDGGIDVDNFNINGTTIALSSGDMTVDVAGDIILDAGGDTIFLKDSGTTFGSLDNNSDNLIIKSGTTTAATFSGANVVLAGTVQGTTITATTAFVPDASGGADLGTTALEFNDAFFNDSAVINFGDDQDTTLTHTDGTGLTLNSTNKLCFNDTSQFVQGSSATVLSLGATDEIDLTATAIDINGTCDVSGAFTTGTTIVATGAITGASLTADDVAINGKAITMTGSSSDTAVLTVGTNGTLSIVTVDAAAAAANIQITADGTVDIDSAGVLTLDSGAAINIEPAAGSAILLDGTISVDAGVVTGATSITSTAFVGDITGDVTGTADTATLATTVTITDNESTNENNAIIFTAGGDLDGGSLGLESDGDLHYNPSTGTLSVTNIVTSGTHTVTDSVTMNANNAVVFEGSTADGYETTLTSVDATADHTISLPNVAGTLPVLAAASTTAITSTPEELNLLDGVSGLVQADLTKLAAVDSTAAELNIVDGGTSATATTLAAADRVVVNDNGTMVQVAMSDFETFMESNLDTLSSVTTVGALDAGSITSGFGAIDNGTSNIRSATITAETAFVPDASGGADLGTTALEFNDAFFNDGAVINFGDDQDTTLTHTDGTGLTLNSTNKLCFNDASQYIQGASNAVLDIAATDEIELTATLIDVVGNFTNSGTIVSTGKITADAGIDIDNFNIDGTTIALSSGDMVLDSAGDIILDADGADINFKDGGTSIFHISNDNSGDVHLECQVSDKDLYLRGNDGGSIINAVYFDMSAAGAATFNNDVTAFSDERLKSNIETIDNALDKVCAMRGVTFTRNDNDDKPGTGVIAQEIREVFPVVVKENTDEDKTLSVSYGNLVGILIEAIKELKEEIETLKGN